ncbi:hypothetical protein DFQ27_007853 [Actinomortierella ambigua]|uniref:Alpha/beta hydrolase n=1 Tax=Actinomortierella ambigua TaxID=1343610 RepID=A0A9P6PTX8_9FUNG|nr:hypothetical protein DFQ27_007853 [Actinomortierella ambigua]
MTPAEVTFSTSNSIKLSGHLYIPTTYQPGQKLPAIAVAHPGGGVKEQTADTEGTPRHVKDSYQGAEDIKAAVLVLWASVPGEAYSIHAVSTDQRVKALATVSMAATLPRFEAAQVAAGEARTHYARTGCRPMKVREGSEYYLTSRGWPCSIDQQDGRLGATNISRTMIRFCKIEHIAPLAPFLLVAGEVADTLKYSQRALEKALELKEPFLVLGASHIELYDRKVSQVTHKVVDFFKKSL